MNSTSFCRFGLRLIRLSTLSATSIFLLNFMLTTTLFAESLTRGKCWYDLSDDIVGIHHISPPAFLGGIYLSSNTSGLITNLNFLENGDVNCTQDSSTAMDADGIYYDALTDVLYQVNRSENVINAYSNFSTSPTLSATSSSDFVNGRGLTTSGRKLVVAQAGNEVNGNTNKFHVYDFSPTEITLDKVLETDIDLLGIDAKDNHLFAIQDNSNHVVIYTNFFDQPAGPIVADQRITVDSLIRPYGIFYEPSLDFLLITDIGEESKPADGAIVVINNFLEAALDNRITANEQIRVAGGSSLLGNPVDISYDPNTKDVYVADRTRNGGMLLGYKFPLATGGIAPIYQKSVPGASALFITNSTHFPSSCDSIIAGDIRLADGGLEKTIFIDGEPDLISFISETDYTDNKVLFTFVVTTERGIITSIPEGNVVDFEPAGIGICHVYGLAYSGKLLIGEGDQLFKKNIVLASECAKISESIITINRVSSRQHRTQFFTSSNTSGFIGRYQIMDNGEIISSLKFSTRLDADGIAYDPVRDVVYQLSRGNHTINKYIKVSSNTQLTATSSADFTNGRGIAVSGNKLIAVQDADDSNGNQNQLLIYTLTGAAISLDKIIEVDFDLWGIYVEGNRLLAVQDHSNAVAIFDDFFENAPGLVAPTSVFRVEGLVRTHGITSNVGTGTLVLTDIGDAGSDEDGALVVVENYVTAINDGVVRHEEQIRISGSETELGNPVDVAWDVEGKALYVAERAVDGGRVLGFRYPTENGTASPIYRQLFVGISSIDIGNSPIEDSLTLSYHSEVLTTAKIFPNPVYNVLQINLPPSKINNGILNIYNIYGQKVQSQHVNLLKEQNQISIDVSRLPTGAYIIGDSNLKLRKKFIKSSN